MSTRIANGSTAVRMINRTINGVYVVSVERGRGRVRVLEAAPAEPVQCDTFFRPGRLLSLAESRPFHRSLV